MRYASTLFVVEDIARSKDFYTRVLGQKIEVDFGKNVGFVGGFAIHQKAHFQALIGGRSIAARGNDAELYFEHDDVQGIEAELAKAGGEFIHSTREEPWRQRVLRLYDPDGHIIEIGESMAFLCSRLAKEGLTVEETSKATGLTVDMVRGFLR
jgi:catechol 2,3-dioxygenase-like lactoylglutathione lyase family enzyme